MVGQLAVNTQRIETKELVKSYRGRIVVDRVNLTLEQNEIIGLLGPNGAGKTTTFYMMIGLIRPDSGRVFLNNQDISTDPMYLRARKGITYLPQEPSVFRKLTVEENLLAVLEGMNGTSLETKERVKTLLSDLDISHLAKHRSSFLSGGERRRLEISRALVTEPKFMLLDEPFAGIDPLILNDIKKIIKQLKDRGIGIIISDHNVRETLDVCDSAHIIHQGKIIESGAPEEILGSKIARSAYLGDNFDL
jgi:lipopolysaccharide export system ATP-binding protein